MVAKRPASHPNLGPQGPLPPAGKAGQCLPRAVGSHFSLWALEGRACPSTCCPARGRCSVQICDLATRLPEIGQRVLVTGWCSQRGRAMAGGDPPLPVLCEGVFRPQSPSRGSWGSRARQWLGLWVLESGGSRFKSTHQHRRRKSHSALLTHFSGSSHLRWGRCSRTPGEKAASSLQGASLRAWHPHD